MMRRLIALMFTLIMASIGTLAMAQGPDKLILQLNKSKSDTNRTHTLIKIGYYYLNESGINSKLDSADGYLKRAQELNRKSYVAEFQNMINICFASIDCWRHPDRDPRNAFLPLIADCRKTGDKPNEMTAWEYLAYFINPDDKSNPFRLTCYQNAISLARQINKGDDEMDDLRNIADIHYQQKKYELAESELFQIIKDGKKAGPRNLMFTTDMLAAMYTNKGEYDKALSYALKTEKAMQTTGDSVVAITFYTRLATIYRHLGMYSSSVEWQKKTLSNLVASGQTRHMFFSSMGIVTDYIAAGKADAALAFISNVITKYKPKHLQDKRVIQKSLGDCYYALKKYDLAEKNYLEMVRLTALEKSNPLTIDQVAGYAAIGNFYLNRGVISKAQKYLMIALRAEEHAGTIASLKDIHLSLFKIDSALGNFKSAIAHLQQNSRFKDSIFNVSKNKQIEELQIKYATDQKDKNFRFLQEKEKLEQVKLKQAQNTRNWIIAGTFMVLIIAGLLYRQSAIRKKSNQIITHKNELLQRLLTEKEWLLKEVHHRVKNNLHTVICLLESQAAYLENDALMAIENSQHRIYAMSLIHQKLYQSDDIKTIDMAEYIRELVQSLEDSFDVSGQIQFKLAIAPVKLDISHAIPLGLIINEAVTNSIKYAFPDQQKGKITISMIDSGPQIILQLADNGIGMSATDRGTVIGSLGLELMKGLSEDIDADISFEVDNGTKITIKFRPEALNDSQINIKPADTKEMYL